MSREFWTPTSGTSYTLYVQLFNGSEIFNTVTNAFEIANSSNWAKYCIAMTQDDTSGVYHADFPSIIVNAGNYPYIIRKKIGSTYAVTDDLFASGTVAWTGNAESSTSTTYLTTIDYIKTALTLDADYDTFINGVLPAVDNAINRYLKYTVISTDREEILNGRGTSYVRTRTVPLTALDHITFDDGITQTTYQGNQFIFQPKVGRIQFKPTVNAYFPEGFQNIKIYCTTGYINVPADIQLAAASMVQKIIQIMDPDIQVASRSEGNVTVKYTNDIDLTNPIYSVAKQLLDGYINLRYI